MKIIFLTLFPLSVFAQLQTIENPLENKQRFFPLVQVELNTKLQSNINLDDEFGPKNIVTEEVQAKTEFTNSKSKNFLFITRPNINFEYAPELEDQVRGIGFNNTFLALFMINSQNSLETTFSQGYSDNYDLDENNELINSKMAYLETNGTYRLQLTNETALACQIGTRIEDHADNVDPTNDQVAFNDRQRDNWTFYAATTPTYKFSEYFAISLPLRIQRKLYREREALTITGDVGAGRAERAHFYSAAFEAKSIFDKFTLKAAIGYDLNEDRIVGGRTYYGPTLALEGNYDLKDAILSSRFSLKVRNYNTQLVDISAISTESPTLDQNIINWHNAYQKNDFLGMPVNLKLGYTLQRTLSNRASDENTNHIYQVGFIFNI